MDTQTSHPYTGLGPMDERGLYQMVTGDHRQLSPFTEEALRAYTRTNAMYPQRPASILEVEAIKSQKNLVSWGVKLSMAECRSLVQKAMA